MANTVTAGEPLTTSGLAASPNEPDPPVGSARTDTFNLVRAAHALSRGDNAAAEQLIRAVLKVQPRNVAAMRLLAEIGLRLGRLEDAQTLLTASLGIAPGFHLARHSYANLLFKMLRYREALAEIDKVLAAEPDRPSHLLLKASILAQTGNADQAIAFYDNVLQKHPSEVRPYLGKAHALKTVGRQAEAVAACRTAIALQPDLAEAYWCLADLKTFRFDGTDVLCMRELLDAGAWSADNHVYLSFALAKALEDRGDFDESFRHYANGNAARRRGVHWDADKHHADIAEIIAFFVPEFFEARGETGNPSSAPIFIVGLPRAGSTLLEQVLASHSQVEGTMELPDVMVMARRLGGRDVRDRASQYPQVLAGLAPADLEALGTAYLERTARHRSGAPRFIDKMPNNFAYIGLIHLMFPNAKIVDARRHPMACCFSVFKQLFVHGQNFSYSLEEIGRYYRDYAALMSHWDFVLPGRVLRVDYESVVCNTAEEVRRLLDFCELPFEARCLEFHRTERAVRTASAGQVRQPVYRSSVEQWRNFDAHLAPLAAIVASRDGGAIAPPLA